MLPISSITSDYVDELTDLMTNEPNMQACFKRLMNAALANDIIVEENGKPLEQRLKRVIESHYRTFLRNAMQQAFICGFVAIYIRRPEGIPLPYVMPMGTFTWNVDVIGSHSKRRRFENGNSVLKYRVQVLHGPVSDSELHVLAWRDPILYRNRELARYSPIEHLLVKFKRLEKTFEMLNEVNRWNAEKHVAITESVDLKDQTTSGIQLLDDMRRYTLTGQHGHGPTGVMRMRGKNNLALDTVNEATMHWLRDQFTARDGGKDAQFHCLPANMNIQELSTIEAGRELQIMIHDYSSSVYSFFDVPRLTDIGGSNTISSGEQMSRHQYLNVLSTCQFMEQLATAAYCWSFQVDISAVQVTLNPQTRLEINSAADVKALADAEILSDFDKKHFKKLFMSSKNDRK